MTNKKKPGTLSFRLNVLFLITFLLFSTLIFRLGFIQIVHGEEYRNETEKQSVRKVSVEAPRGWIMDRKGEVLVHNVPVYTVSYTDNNNAADVEKETIAQRLAQFIDMDAEQIMAKMSQGTPFVPQSIKQNLTFKEVSKVNEHLDQLPGVDVVVDPRREYRHGNLFNRYIGTVGSIQQDEVNYYLSRGYRLNEKVGRSFLEKQYEEQLRGTQAVIEIPVDSKQRPLGEPMLTPGQRGNDLVLTIDMHLQHVLEEAIRTQIEEQELVNDIFFVAMEPNTGEILAMSNDVRSVGAGKTSWAAGSTVKMATVLMGLNEGIVTPQTKINDRTITIGNIKKSSWTTLGSVNVYRALQRSSNIYMFHIGLTVAEREGLSSAFDTSFNYFSQFGLGVKTGIDLPDDVEYDGYKSNQQLPGLLADYMIGQYHNYTPLQLAQYVSTIANGGYRLQPYLVKEIRRGVPAEDEMGQVIMRREPKVLNRIEMSDEDIRIVQRGMELVTEGDGTAATTFGNFPVKVAGKTGTAQTVNHDGTKGLNNTLFVGYAPADNPQIAFASVVPQSQKSQAQNNVAHAQVIAEKVLRAFFEGSQELGTDEEGQEQAEE